MSKNLRFTPPDKLYYKLKERFFMNEKNQKDAKKKDAEGSLKKMCELLSPVIYHKFFQKEKERIEPRIATYFKLEKKIGISILAAALGNSYASQPKRHGMKIEVADLICKYISDDFKMTFYKWIGAESLEDLEKRLTDFYKLEKIGSLESLYDYYDQIKTLNKKSPLSDPITIPQESLRKDFERQTNIDGEQFRLRVMNALNENYFQETVNTLVEHPMITTFSNRVALSNIVGELNNLRRVGINKELEPESIEIELNKLKRRLIMILDDMLD